MSEEEQSQSFDFKSKEELLVIWKNACENYYNSDDPDMSDVEFDELTEILEGFNDPEINRVLNGIYQDGDVSEVTAQTVMISLHKIKYKDISSVSDIRAFFRTNNKAGKVLLKAPKFDGMAIKVIKHQNTIKLIQTRGGIDVTNHLINHKNIQQLLIEYPEKEIIHGEMICPIQYFKDNYSAEYRNPRNFVPGLFKAGKEPKFDIIDTLKFITYSDGISPMGKYWTECTMDDFVHLPDIIARYKSNDFLCDGIVIGFETDVQIIKPNTNYPSNMVAIKFKAPSAQTKVIDVDYSQKKSGNLTPVYAIEPTELDGSTVTSANGYNYSKMIEQGIGIGAIITITKSGDIIPVVHKVIKKSTNFKYPDCDYQVIGKHAVAMDSEISRQYKFILALRLMQIDGIGETLAEQIGSVVNYQIFDLFNQKFKPNIREILGGGKNWNKFEIFYQTKSLYLDQVIALHQFNRVGTVLAKKVALLISGKSKDTSNMDKTILTNVCRGEGFKRITESIKYLATHGVKTLPPIEINDETLTYEMSGTCKSNISKDEFEILMKKKFPNSIHTTLTKETKYLVVDDLQSTAGKLNKARKYNIPILTYEQMLNKK